MKISRRNGRFLKKKDGTCVGRREPKKRSQAAERLSHLPCPLHQVCPSATVTTPSSSLEPWFQPSALVKQHQAAMSSIGTEEREQAATLLVQEISHTGPYFSALSTVPADSKTDEIQTSGGLANPSVKSTRFTPVGCNYMHNRVQNITAMQSGRVLAAVQWTSVTATAIATATQ